VGLGRGVEVEPGGPSSRAGDPRIGIDHDGAHPRQVDHEPVLDRAMPGGVVSATSHRHLELVRAGEMDGRRDVSGIDASRDRGRTPIDHQVEAEPSPLVFAITWREDIAGQRAAKLEQILAHRSPAGVTFRLRRKRSSHFFRNLGGLTVARAGPSTGPC
jgi:hypothetical protein